MSSLPFDTHAFYVELELKISENKADLIRWVVGVGLLQITIIAGLVLKLTGHV